MLSGFTPYKKHGLKIYMWEGNLMNYEFYDPCIGIIKSWPFPVIRDLDNKMIKF